LPSADVAWPYLEVASGSIPLFLIASKARATSAGGTVMPSSFADFTLTINSNRTRRIL
jgi:hypothetical protein